MFDYRWSLKDGYPADNVEKHGLKVFSTFACGGGSCMGYKLAGYDVIAANDIDPVMERVYKENHNPKHYYLCDIRDLNKKIKNKEVDEELFDLDILDGSPPCSVFSVAGKREKGWGKEKIFREGQTKQILDDLFFHFIETTKLLQPKVVIAENVKGLIKGNAKGYVLEIMKGFKDAGYKVQLFSLNSATMGVPQSRERVFFIGYRNDLNFEKIKINFTEKPIPYGEIREDVKNYKPATKLYQRYWKNAKRGEPVGKFNTVVKQKINRPVNTMISGNRHFDCIQPRRLTDKEISLAGSFPLDYVPGENDLNYLIGMSVPPVMIAKIAHEIYLQWLK